MALAMANRASLLHCPLNHPDDDLLRLGGVNDWGRMPAQSVVHRNLVLALLDAGGPDMTGGDWVDLLRCARGRATPDAEQAQLIERIQPFLPRPGSPEEIALLACAPAGPRKEREKPRQSRAKKSTAKIGSSQAQP